MMKIRKEIHNLFRYHVIQSSTQCIGGGEVLITKYITCFHQFIFTKYINNIVQRPKLYTSENFSGLRRHSHSLETSAIYDPLTNLSIMRSIPDSKVIVGRHSSVAEILFISEM